MTSKAKSYRWFIALALFFFLSLLIVFNLQRYQCNDRKIAFGSAFASARPAEGTWNDFSFTARGLLLSEYQSLQFFDLPLSGRNHFTVKIRLLAGRVAGAFITLSTRNGYRTLPIEGEWPTGRAVTLSLHRQDDLLDLSVDGIPAGSGSISDSEGQTLKFTCLESRLYLQSVELLSESGQRLYSRTFLPALSGPFRILSAVFIVFLFLLALSIVDQRIGNGEDAKSTPVVILLLTAPVWAGTLIPAGAPAWAAFVFFSGLSLLLFVFRWNQARLERFRFRVGGALSLMALSGLGEILFSLFTARVAGPCLAGGAALLFVCAWSLGKPGRKSVGRGLGRLIAPLAVAAFWPMARIATRLSGDPLLAQEQLNGLSSALLLAACLMMLQILFSARRQLSAYTPLLLLMILSSVGMGELVLRHSGLEPLPRPDDRKTDLSRDPFVALLRDGDRDVPFRSGPTDRQPPPNVERIMVLGGSTTYGLGIDENRDTFPGVLETCLNDEIGDRAYEVINAGARGFNLFFLLRNFESFGLSYHPDRLIVYINALDSLVIEGPLTLHDLENLNPASRRRLVGSWIDSSRPAQDSSEIHALQKLFARFYLYAALKRAVTEARADSLKSLALWTGALKDTNPPEDYRENLKRLVSLCTRNQIDLLFVNEFDPFNAAGKNPKRAALEAIGKEEAEKGGFGYLDLQAEFLLRSDAESLFFTEPSLQYHYNQEGHRQIGQRLCRWISDLHNTRKKTE